MVRTGRGTSGDYDSSNPDDIELLRFDVSRKEGEAWVAIDDASYCTNVPVIAHETQRSRLLELLMSEIYEPASQGHSIKKLCERLSWIGLDWIEGLKEQGRKMTLKKIKEMFTVGQTWNATNTYIEKACGPRVIVDIRGGFVISSNRQSPHSRMEWPKASQIIEARLGYLKFRFPDHIAHLKGHTLELIKA